MFCFLNLPLADVEPALSEARGNFDSRNLAHYSVPKEPKPQLSSGTYEYTFVENDSAPRRIDINIVHSTGIPTRSAAQKLIKQGSVLVNSAVVKPNYLLKNGDVVAVSIPQETPTELIAQDIPLDIVYEDSDLMVINKPRGMTVHPAPGHADGTLVNAVLGYTEQLSKVGGASRPGIVHRLDKDTSGLLMVAKTDEAHLNLSSQLQNRAVRRLYYAVVWGNPTFEQAEVDAPIGRHPKDRQRMAVIKDTQRATARDAQTNLSVVEKYRGFSMLEAALQTGRTHQIRVHLSHIGFPVVGDPLYCPKRSIPASLTKTEQSQLRALVGELDGQALHAFRLEFAHPTTGARFSFESPMPQVMMMLVDWLRNHR